MHVSLTNLDEPPHATHGSKWRSAVRVVLVGDRCVYVYLVLSLIQMMSLYVQRIYSSVI